MNGVVFLLSNSRTKYTTLGANETQIVSSASIAFVSDSRASRVKYKARLRPTAQALIANRYTRDESGIERFKQITVSSIAGGEAQIGSHGIVTTN